MAEQDEAQDFAKRAPEVGNADYLHWIIVLSAAAYAWQFYGIWTGLLVFVGLLMATIMTDLFIHWFMLLWAAAYAWQLHGILTGLLVFVGLLMTIIVTNLIILLSEFGSLRMVRFNRWFWMALAFVALAVSGASIETVG